MTSYEQELLGIEQAKIALETQKLEVERRKARWTFFSVSVPVIAASITILFGFMNAREQAQQEFQLQILKTVAEEDDPNAALGRYQFFSAMFPGKLSTTANVDPSKFTDPGFYEAKSKLEFLQEMRQSGLPRDHLLALWRALFNGDDWAKDPKLDNIIAH